MKESKARRRATTAKHTSGSASKRRAAAKTVAGKEEQIRAERIFIDGVVEWRLWWRHLKSHRRDGHERHQYKAELCFHSSHLHDWIAQKSIIAGVETLAISHQPSAISHIVLYIVAIDNDYLRKFVAELLEIFFGNSA